MLDIIPAQFGNTYAATTDYMYEFGSFYKFQLSIIKQLSLQKSAKFIKYPSNDSMVRQNQKL